MFNRPSFKACAMGVFFCSAALCSADTQQDGELDQEIAALKVEVQNAQSQIADKLIKSDNLSMKKKKQIVKALRKAFVDSPSNSEEPVSSDS